MKTKIKVSILLLSLLLLITSCTLKEPIQNSSDNLSSLIESTNTESSVQSESFTANSPSYDNLNDTETLPLYSGSPFVAINNNIPYFTDDEKKQTASFEKYTQLDSLERCQVTYACIGKDLMPTEDRGNIGNIKPTGWQTVKYDFVDGKYLYNRCHLIGFQLTGENDNKRNLITGTRYMNVQGMLPFENMVADYIKETENHVLYRATPIFHKNELLARGVQIEAWSVEDNGEGICFNVYCFNVQPGVTINYATGQNKASAEISSSASVTPSNSVSSNVSSVTSSETTDQSSSSSVTSSPKDNTATLTYVLNTNTKKFHHTTCRHVSSIKKENYSEFSGTRDSIISQGYSPCGTCKP